MYIYDNISLSFVFFKLYMVQTKFVEKIKTNFMFSKFFPKSFHLEPMWINTLQLVGPQMTIYHGACWITKATNTHSK
jgi:hypothetical protein